MGIKIKSADEFLRLLEALANELVDANIYYQMHVDLLAAVDRYSREFNQALAFWSTTQQAHLDAAVFRLCKIYDHHKGVLSLPNFLETIAENVEIFSVDKFRERLKNNPFVESLATDARQPDPDQLERDRAYVSEENPLVKTLTRLRNNFYAHRGAKDLLAASDLGLKYPLTKDEVGELLKSGMEIVNRYSLMFHANAYSTQIVGRDDYLTVLDAARADLEQRDRKLKEELEMIDRLDGRSETGN